jgi:hypothetical protein
MFTQAQLDRLIEAMRANAVVTLEVTTKDDTLKLDLGEAAIARAPIAPAVPVAVKQMPAKSPCIGRFVPLGTDDGLSPLEELAVVKTGDTLGYIAQGQARALVVAPVSGTLVRDHPIAGAVFGYGDVVFNLEASA